jgi:hypothetical protein
VGRRTDAVVDPVSDHPVEVAQALSSTAGDPPRSAANRDTQLQQSHLPAFMLGTVVGALAGTLVGTLVSPHTRAYLVGLYQLVSRRLSSAERDKLRFELLLQ